MRRRIYAPEPVEVLEPETWDAPSSLNDAALRAQTGQDGRREADALDKENEG